MKPREALALFKLIEIADNWKLVKKLHYCDVLKKQIISFDADCKIIKHAIKL